ncbi:polyprenyl synthetase family protein [Amycolatopsis sp. cg5]|uniref:polyprenyl synthetase family protein n=1 Tax=Amycolatopsis sp. cg5 TaxID=3238802 RepID=UPI00352531B3
MSDAPAVPMPDTISIFLLDKLQRELEYLWPPGAEPIHEMSRYALLPPGKLLRPQLFMHSAKAVGGNPEPLLAAALSVEYLHVGSLIHDDVIDDDAIRRGRPSVQARYGVPGAIVSGDALMLRSISILVTHATNHAPAASVIKAARMLAETGEGLCRGQALEAKLCGDVRCGLSSYRSMVEQKTGALFQASCEIGALLGGGAAPQVRALNRFGHHLGIAFQMWDDLLSYVSGEERTGKPGRSDAANRRPTLPVLVGYDVADEAGRAQFELALSGKIPESDAHGLLLGLLDDSGALPLAEEMAARETQVAKSYLADLPDPDTAAELAALADAAIRRRG